MPIFYFRVNYDGGTYDDESGELLQSLEEACVHAATIVSELGRNSKKVATVFVVGEEGQILAKVPAPISH